MNYYYILRTILCILGAIPEFCSCSENGNGSESSDTREETNINTNTNTNSNTNTNNNINNHKLRNEFVQAMDRAYGRKKNDETFLSRLSELAIPASEHPGFMRSQSQTTYERNYNRNLEDEYDYENYAYAVNLTNYALKYIGCSNIRTWSDDLAAGDNNDDDNNIDSVLRMDRFVLLRLCPRDSCSNYNKYGCMENFGDYLIPMETYLQVMAETYFAQYQEYCETCYECMNAATDDNNNDDDGANNNGNDDGDDYYNNGDDGNYNDDGGGRRRLNDDANDAWYNYNYNNYVDDDDANNANQAAGCYYYAVCENYQNACQEYSNLGFDLQDYFACAEFNIGNGVGYLGPHCSSDGKKISMGIFSDQYCNQYSADLSEVSSYMSVNENELEAYYSDNCISCLASVSSHFPLFVYSRFGILITSATNDGKSVCFCVYTTSQIRLYLPLLLFELKDGYLLDTDNDDDAYSDIAEVCDALYGVSAKCNKYMGNDDNYVSTNQEAQEDTVCDFISDLLTNSYDEYGEIVLQQDGWMTYVPDILNTIPKWQKYALSASILSVICMFVYACYLYRKITRRKIIWYPRGRKGYSTSYPGMEPTSINGRLHSGIIQGRSHSSGNFEMKDGGIIS